MLHEKEATSLPEGFVVANDIDPKRCYMLVHQSRRIHSPCCLVTNHDAAAFPDINIKQVILITRQQVQITWHEEELLYVHENVQVLTNL